MNAPIDTLAFARRSEEAGFGHEQARILAATFGETSDTIRDGLVTKDHLDLRLAELEARLNKQFGELEVRLTRHVGESARDVTRRLWSAVAIIAGVSTAVSATIGASVTLLLRSGAL